MAHEDDEIDVRAGRPRRDVGFTPRASDRWPIDGKAPMALPRRPRHGPPDGGQPQRIALDGHREARASPARQPTATPRSRTPQSPRRPGRRQPPRSAPRPRAIPPRRRIRRRTTRAAEPPRAPSDAPVDAPPAATSPAPAAGVAYTRAGPGPPSTSPPPPGSAARSSASCPYWELSGASTKLNYDVALDHRLLLGRAPTSSGNLKKRDADGTSTTGWGGWTSSSMTSVINAAHQRGTRVVLTISVFAWTSEPGLASRRRSSAAPRPASTSPARPRPPSAIAARTASTWTSSRSRRATPTSSSAFLKTVRSELNKIRSGYQLTYDTTGYIGNYPLEASVARRARPTRSSSWATTTGPPAPATAGSIDPLSGPKYDLTDTVRAYTARVSPPRASSSACPGTAAPGPRPPTPSASSTLAGAKYGYSTAVNYETRHRARRQVRPPLGRRRSRARTSSTGARTAPARTAASRAGARSTTTTPRR